MKKLKIFTAVVAIGNGTSEVGLFKSTVEVEACSEKSARKKALELALRGTDVSVDLSIGKAKETNAVYQKTYGKSESW